MVERGLKVKGLLVGSTKCNAVEVVCDAMRCINPKTIWPHRSVEWEDEHESRPFSVPCGKCLACLSNKRNDWSFRLEQEYKAQKSAIFVTLTYDQRHYPSDGSLCKKHVQLFLKRLRKAQNDNAIRYYAVGEYGSKSGRPHYHLLLFNAKEDLVRKAWCDYKGRPIGIVHIGTVTAASVAYCTKYIIQKDDYPENLEKPFSLMSRAYGIGAHYLTDEMVAWHRADDRNYALRWNQKVRLPRFYREKIWYKQIDRERIGSKALSMSLDNAIKEWKFFEQRYGERASVIMKEHRDAVISRIKQKVAYTQYL